MEYLYRWIRIFFNVWPTNPSRYLANHPKVKGWVQLQMSSPNPSGESQWLSWDHWPQSWRDRVDEFYKILKNGGGLPVPDEPLIFTREEKQAKRVLNLDERNIYKTHDVAREVYFAHVAHTIYLDTKNIVPWKLNDYSENELRYLMSSSNIMSMIKLRDGEDVYANSLPGQKDASRAIIGNPRVPYNFLKNEPEEGARLIGDNQAETIGNLSAWLADYLNHNPGPPFSYQSYMRENPYLTDWLGRQAVSFQGEEINVYLSPIGCWSASDLIANLLRSVNIPIRKVTNRLEKFDQSSFGQHSGIIYNWQGGGGRFLLHTDSLFTESLNFIPTNPNENSGMQIFNHNWLDLTQYGNNFTFLHGEEDFSSASWDGIEKYKSRARHLLPMKSILPMILQNREDYLPLALNDGLTQAEALSNYDRVEAILQAHGDGDKMRGMDRVNQLYDQWNVRTGKIQ